VLDLGRSSSGRQLGRVSHCRHGPFHLCAVSKHHATGKDPENSPVPSMLKRIMAVVSETDDH
jgi:hypothetical protein